MPGDTSQQIHGLQDLDKHSLAVPELVQEEVVSMPIVRTGTIYTVQQNKIKFHFITAALYIS